MKNPVAKHLNTFNKPSVVPQKQRKLKSDASLRDAREEAQNELAESQFESETMCFDDGCNDGCEGYLDCIGCSSIEIDCEED